MDHPLVIPLGALFSFYAAIGVLYYRWDKVAGMLESWDALEVRQTQLLNRFHLLVDGCDVKLVETLGLKDFAFGTLPLKLNYYSRQIKDFPITLDLLIRPHILEHRISWVSEQQNILARELDFFEERYLTALLLRQEYLLGPDYTAWFDFVPFSSFF